MIIVLMGVAGSGKTTIGQLLADELGLAYYDGDDFHPPANVAKMSQGIALNDDDRAGWLDALARLIGEHAADGRSCVVSCSALRQAYRERLAGAAAGVRFVYLKGSYALIQARLSARKGHFMKPTMLESQFATLEEPADALTVAIDQPPAQIVQAIIAGLGR
jgi:gluconokinase